MQKIELDRLTRDIQYIHKNFIEDERLLDYNYDKVRNNWLKNKSSEEITFEALTKGLVKEGKLEMRIQCDLCKTWIPYSSWEEYDTHWRRCSKIDFINRQAKELGGKGIDYGLYREMSNEELDRRYRQIMNNYEKSHSKQEILEMI